MKMPSYQYRKSHCGDKTVVRPPYLHNGISYTSKMASLYWFSPQVTYMHIHLGDRHIMYAICWSINCNQNDDEEPCWQCTTSLLFSGHYIMTPLILSPHLSNELLGCHSSFLWVHVACSSICTLCWHHVCKLAILDQSEYKDCLSSD